MVCTFHVARVIFCVSSMTGGIVSLGLWTEAKEGIEWWRRGDGGG